MSRLEIEFEWIAPEGGKGAELRATWARFGLRAGSEWVTRVEDLAAHSVRTGIYGPLYPLAEWLAVNWWSLLHEVPTPRKEQGLDYRRRHCIDGASEGFALPSLSIRPEGSLIALECEQKSIPSARISFISNGRLFVDVNDFEDTLRSFIQAVIARLKECGVTGTLLEQEWDAVESADSEEKEFCLAVGRLGGDPYSADGQDYLNALAEVSRCLPGSILDEFLAATVADRMVQHATVLAHLLSDARTEAIKADTLSEVKSALSATLNRARQTASTTVTPWETGYEVARELRAVMGADPDWTISNKRELSRILRTNPDEWLMRLPGLLHSDQVCQAVVAHYMNILWVPIRLPPLLQTPTRSGRSVTGLSPLSSLRLHSKLGNLSVPPRLSRSRTYKPLPNTLARPNWLSFIKSGITELPLSKSKRSCVACSVRIIVRPLPLCGCSCRLSRRSLLLDRGKVTVSSHLERARVARYDFVGCG